MISQTAEYALRAIVFLADQNEPQTNAQIANATEVPVGYLAKVMQSLSRASVVTAQRGLRGGFKLAHDPRELTVLNVVSTIDPVRRFHECPLGLHGIDLCPLHRSLDDAAKAVEDAFGDTTIANLLDVPQHRKPLCQFPAPSESTN
jgi:Rrf2 family transcriptional regulator, nitric oxide-sensitive transcriptional repressor